MSVVEEKSSVRSLQVGGSGESQGHESGRYWASFTAGAGDLRRGVRWLAGRRDAILVAVGGVYVVGYFVWAINAFVYGLGLLPAADLQYFVAGFIPVASFTLGWVLLRAIVKALPLIWTDLGPFWVAVRRRWETALEAIRRWLRSKGLGRKRWMSRAVKAFRLPWLLAGPVLVFAKILPWISVPGGAVVLWGGLAGWVVGLALFNFITQALDTSNGGGGDQRAASETRASESGDYDPGNPSFMGPLRRIGGTLARRLQPAGQVIGRAYLMLMGIYGVGLILGLILVLPAAVLAFLIFVAYPSVPQEFGGVRPRCAHLEVATSEISRQTLGSLMQQRNPEDETLPKVVQTSELDIMYSRGDLLLVRPRDDGAAADRRVYEMRGGVRALVGCR